jgi:DNA polymerase-3 subunit epsilon
MIAIICSAAGNQYIGEIVNKSYSLICPEQVCYINWNMQMHGNTCEDKINAPIFLDVWRQIEPLHIAQLT